MSESVMVNIPQGTLRGKKVTSASNGVTYYSFQGIPYAKPPVGPLRFKPPEEPERWTGTKDATAEGSVAPQIDIFSLKFVGEEDCLFLNVYTKEWPTSSPKAVMVWIHGGGFMMGSGNTDFYGPDYLVAEDVVVVTLNYRLGALGFVYLEGTDVIGNNGLRDQVMALKWVKNNIAQFGGDPGNVTIFGESAGGISVHLLMMAPTATGLFHRAIAQSGTAMLGDSHIHLDVSSQRAVICAKMLGCTSEDPQEVADFLKTVTPEELVAHQGKALSDEDKRRPMAMPFFPTEEVGPNAFLPASPRKLLQEGRFAQVPFITGVTTAEGKVMLFDAFNRLKISELDQQFDNVLPPNVIRKLGKEKSKEAAKILKKLYFGDKSLVDDMYAEYIDLMSDLLFVFPALQTVQLQTRWSQHPTYIYLFDRATDRYTSLLPAEINALPGATHAAELAYMFESSIKPNNFSPESVDYKVCTTVVKLWAAFAKTGNPSNNEANVTWVPAKKGKLSYLKINGGFNMDSDMYKQRMESLQDLFNKYVSSEHT